MNAYAPALSQDTHGRWLRTRHARRRRTRRRGSAGPVLALGTAQALMGLAAYRARNK